MYGKMLCPISLHCAPFQLSYSRMVSIRSLCMSLFLAIVIEVDVVSFTITNISVVTLANSEKRNDAAGNV